MNINLIVLKSIAALGCVGLISIEGFALTNHHQEQEKFTHHVQRETVLIAQKSRKKRLSAEGKIRQSGDKTVIDFESVDIVGDRRTPLGSMINQNKANKGYDFVKIRLRWHPEMKKSASSLDTQ